MNRRTLLTIALGAGTTILSSCSRVLFVVVDGSLGGPLSFHMTSSRTSKAEENLIQSVSVTQRSPNGSWKTIWEISGKAVRRSVEYGAAYEGMITQVSALPLVRDGIYRVHVQAGMLFWQAAPGDGSTSFTFDAITGKAVHVQIQRDGTMLRE